MSKEKEIEELANHCDVFQCKVIGYSVTVDADNHPYHFCSKHFEHWSTFLDGIEEDGVIPVHTKKWSDTLEQFLLYKIVAGELDIEMPFCDRTIKAITHKILDAGYRKPSEADVEKIVSLLFHYSLQIVLRQGTDFPENQQRELAVKYARQLLPLLSKPELKLISDEEIKMLVSEYELQGLNCEQLIRIGAQAQLQADKKAQEG